MQQLDLKILSPEKTFFIGKAEMVVMPGSEGELGVLYGHAPLISSLAPGVINIYNNNIIEKSIFSTTGIAQITQTNCTILADEAFDISELTKEMVTERLHNAKNNYVEDDISSSIELNIAQAMHHALAYIHAK
jgi:F-type H+-transporting ATPase subunit epsilon